MLASLTTLFVRVWEKALFLLALLACLTLCSLATHYFTATQEEENAVGHLLTFGEIVVRAVGIADRHKVGETLQLGSIHLVLVHINLCIGE